MLGLIEVLDTSRAMLQRELGAEVPDRGAAPNTALGVEHC